MIDKKQSLSFMAYLRDVYKLLKKLPRWMYRERKEVVPTLRRHTALTFFSTTMLFVGCGVVMIIAPYMMLPYLSSYALNMSMLILSYAVRVAEIVGAAFMLGYSIWLVSKFQAINAYTRLIRGVKN